MTPASPARGREGPYEWVEAVNVASYSPFGLGTGQIVRTFTILNRRDIPLLLSGTPAVSLSGSGAAHFQVIRQPTTPHASYF